MVHFIGASLTSIEIETGVSTIGIKSFANCNNLITVKLPNSVTNLGWGSFQDCDNLTSVTLSESLTKLEVQMFYNCNNLKSIVIPGSIKTICSTVFSNCTSLENVDIQEGVTTFESSGHFLNCSKLKNISLPSTLTNIGSSTFKNCSSLTNIVIPSHVDTIKDHAFENCTSLKNIIVPSNVKTLESGSFYNCTNLEHIELQEGIENIENSVFAHCTKLSNVKIPCTVNELLYAVFGDCTNLGNVYILNNNIKMTYLNYITNYTIYCKSNSTAEKFASEHSIPYVVDDDGPTISFNPNGNLQPANEQTTIVNIIDDKSVIQDNSLKYIWSQTPQAPSLKDFQNTFSNNDKLIKKGANGNWYLWILAYDIMENYTITSSKAFSLDSTKPTATITTDKEKYYEGETAKITATFNEEIKDGTPKISISGVAKLDKTDMVKSDSKKYTYSYVVPKGTGKQIITISDASDLAGNIMEENTTKEFSIEQLILESIKVTTEPNKKTYKERENFDKTGMKVTATYNNKTSKEITNYTITDGENLTLDKTSVTISYTENEITKTTTQAITVIENEELSFNDYVEVNKDNKKYLTNIKNSTTIEQFKNNIKTNATIKIYKNNKEITSNNEKISTGMKIKIELNNETLEYSLVIKGDVNGDGVAEIKDLLTLNKHRLNKTLLENEYFLAGDIDNDNVINIRDLLQLNKFRLRKINVL